MSVTGSRVAIIGGSIAGCAAAIALTRAGCDVTVFERTRGSLQDRGFGISIPPSTFGTLVSASYVDETMTVVRAEERLFVVKDDAAPAGRVLWRQPLPVLFTNWPVLWRTLRARIADSDYRDGTTAIVLDTDDDGATISASGSDNARFSLVIGADGYASSARSLVAPDSSMFQPGYGMWRGTYPADLLPDDVSRELARVGITICFPGGHAIFYLIPDHRNSQRRLVNWAIYITPPRLMADPALIPPGQVPPKLMSVMRRTVATNFPALWASVVERTPKERISLQPIFEVTAPRYVTGRLALAGDAGATARPHTGSGAVKAVQDALELQLTCRVDADWASALGDYNRVRCAAGNDLVAFGRSLGRAQVENTPDWSSMSETDFSTWWREAAFGRGSLYE